MGLEKHPVLVSVLVSKKLSGLGLGLGLEACGLDYNTDIYEIQLDKGLPFIQLYSLFFTETFFVK